MEVADVVEGALWPVGLNAAARNGLKFSWYEYAVEAHKILHYGPILGTRDGLWSSFDADVEGIQGDTPVKIKSGFKVYIGCEYKGLILIGNTPVSLANCLFVTA